MALSAQALCTVADAKTYIGIGDTHKSSFLEYLIEDASRVIIEHLGYDPHSDTYTDELHDGDGSHELVTYARPITTISGIKLWDGDTYAAIDSDDLSQMQNRTWYIDGVAYAFARGRSNYKVSYIAGWSDTEVAKRFRVHALKIVAALEKESGKKGTLGIASQSFGDGARTTYNDAVEKVLNDLQVFRRLS